MKNKKMVLWVVLIATTIIPAFAQQYDSEKDFQIDWDDNVKGGVIIAKYLGSKKEVSIPPSIQNNPVTGIGRGAFSTKDIIKVIIPNGVTSIGERAFSSCENLTSVNIPNSVTLIGICAFEDCTSLTSVTIPNSVISIGERAFNRCKNIISVTIPNSVISIGEYAFFRCENLTSVNIGNSVKSIEEYTFSECTKLTSIKIGNSVTSIGHCAFSYCINLTSITIPDSVKSISAGAFYSCTKLTSVKIPDSVTEIKDYLKMWRDESEIRGAFADCTGLTSLTLGNGIKKIGKYAFKGCTGLTSIIIPNSVNSIGEKAFSDCTNLISVTFLGNITKRWFPSYPDLDVQKPKNMFPGDLREKYLANDGGPGTYTRFAGGEVWKKQSNVSSGDIDNIKQMIITQDLFGTWKNGIGKRPFQPLQYDISENMIVERFTAFGDDKLIFRDLKWEQIANTGVGVVPADISTYPSGFKITGILREKIGTNVRNIGDTEIICIYLNTKKTEFWDTGLAIENNPFVKQ